MSILRTTERMFPIHPGEMLREEFLVPLNLSAAKLAEALKLPASFVTEIVEERRAIEAETALRLSRYFGTTAEFWMNCQTSYELGSISDQVADGIVLEVHPAPRDMESGRLTTHPVEGSVHSSHA